jgi:hypothetical protein
MPLDIDQLEDVDIHRPEHFGAAEVEEVADDAGPG